MGAFTFIIISSIFLIQAVFNQRIQLFQHNKTSKCNIDVVKELDRIIMYGEVNLSVEDLSQSIIDIEIKSKYEKTFSSFCVLLIPEDCDIRNYHYCSCYTTDKTDIYGILIYITAENVTSDAEILATLIFKESFMHSEVIKLPIVYGSPTDAITVYVNGYDVLKTNNVTLNDANVIIYSICHEQFATNCNLQLTSLETQTILKSETQKLAYHDSIKERRRFSLEFKICNIHEEIRFSVSTDNMENNDDLNFPQSVSVLLNCLPFVVIVAVLIVCIVCSILKGVRWDYMKVGIWIKNRCRKYIHDDQNNAKNSNYIEDPIYSHQKKCIVDFTDVPIRYRENELINLLEIISQLSCRVAFGGGLVTNILKYFCGVGINTLKRSQSHACPCPKCLKSKSPSDTWAEIFITTSSSILKNKNYHKQITCVLSTEDNVTTELRDLSVEHKDPKKSGRCLLKYVTCDETLLYKLQVLLEERVRLEEKVQEIFHQHKGHDKIYFALVHREDGTKQICTGSWSERNTKYNVRTYHYDPEIPYGNIGAPVVLLGYGHCDNECNLMRNFLGEVLCNNFSTSVFSIEIVQKIKKPIFFLKTT